MLNLGLGARRWGKDSLTFLLRPNRLAMLAQNEAGLRRSQAAVMGSTQRVVFVLASFRPALPFPPLPPFLPPLLRFLSFPPSLHPSTPSLLSSPPSVSPYPPSYLSLSFPASICPRPHLPLPSPPFLSPSLPSFLAPSLPPPPPPSLPHSLLPSLPPYIPLPAAIPLAPSSPFPSRPRCDVPRFALLSCRASGRCSCARLRCLFHIVEAPASCALGLAAAPIQLMPAETSRMPPIAFSRFYLITRSSIAGCGSLVSTSGPKAGLLRVGASDRARLAAPAVIAKTCPNAFRLGARPKAEFHGIRLVSTLIC